MLFLSHLSLPENGMQGIGYPGNRSGWEASLGGGGEATQRLEFSGSRYHFYAGGTSRELEPPLETPAAAGPSCKRHYYRASHRQKGGEKTTHSPPPVSCHCLPSPTPSIPNIPGAQGPESRDPGQGIHLRAERPRAAPGRWF